MAEMFFRKSIPADALRQFYVDEGWTIEQLAQHYRCGETTIIRRLRDLHIEIRPRGPKPQYDSPNLNWSPSVAYVVGLIATDGNLSGDGRHLSVRSKDKDLLETVNSCLGLDHKMYLDHGGYGSSYNLLWSDRAFYLWLVSIGLMPAKSLKLGALNVPDNVFPDFLRGVIDGDGTIRINKDDWNAFKNPKYVYYRLDITIASASLPFLQWLHATTTRLLGTRGAIIPKKLIPGRSQLWELRYAKKDALVLIRWIYYDPQVPALERKRVRAVEALALMSEKVVDNSNF